MSKIQTYLDAGRCKLTRHYDAEERFFTYKVKCSGSVVGTLRVGRKTTVWLCHRDPARKCAPALRPGPAKKGHPARVSWPIRAIADIHVSGDARRLGVATALYEAAAQDACRAAEPLVSVYRIPKAHSNDFWAKQRKKKRAHIVGRYTFEPGDVDPIYALDCARGTTLSGVRKRRKRR